MKNKGKVKALFRKEAYPEIDTLGKETIQAWVKKNLSRIEFLMPKQKDNFALALLESQTQFRLRPLFEGRGD